MQKMTTRENTSVSWARKAPLPESYSSVPQQGTKINDRLDNWITLQPKPTTNGRSNRITFRWCQQSLHHFYESAGAELPSWSMRLDLMWFRYRFPMRPVEEEANKVMCAHADLVKDSRKSRTGTRLLAEFCSFHFASNFISAIQYLNVLYCCGPRCHSRVTSSKLRYLSQTQLFHFKFKNLKQSINQEIWLKTNT